MSWGRPGRGLDGLHRGRRPRRLDRLDLQRRHDRPGCGFLLHDIGRRHVRSALSGPARTSAGAQGTRGGRRARVDHLRRPQGVDGVRAHCRRRGVGRPGRSSHRRAAGGRGARCRAALGRPLGRHHDRSASRAERPGGRCAGRRLEGEGPRDDDRRRPEGGERHQRARPQDRAARRLPAPRTLHAHLFLPPILPAGRLHRRATWTPERVMFAIVGRRHPRLESPLGAPALRPPDPAPRPAVQPDRSRAEKTCRACLPPCEEGSP